MCAKTIYICKISFQDIVFPVIDSLLDFLDLMLYSVFSFLLSTFLPMNIFLQIIRFVHMCGYVSIHTLQVGSRARHKLQIGSLY